MPLVQLRTPMGNNDGKGLHPSLAVKLSEIYAWTVDFFGLQKGDSFKVIYEELAIDTNSLEQEEYWSSVYPDRKDHNGHTLHTRQH